MNCLQLIRKSFAGLLGLAVMAAAASVFAEGGMPTSDTGYGRPPGGGAGVIPVVPGGRGSVGPGGNTTSIMPGRGGRPGPLVVRSSDNIHGSGNSVRTVQSQPRAMSPEDRRMVGTIQDRLEQLHAARFQTERRLWVEDNPASRFSAKATLNYIRKEIWRYQQVVNSIRNKYIDDKNQRFPVEAVYVPSRYYPPGPPGTHDRF